MRKNHFLMPKCLLSSDYNKMISDITFFEDAYTQIHLFNKLRSIKFKLNKIFCANLNESI